MSIWLWIPGDRGKNDLVGRCREEIANENGKTIVSFLEGNVLMAMNGNRKCETLENTRPRAAHCIFSILDYILIDRGNTNRKTLDVCAFDVGTTDVGTLTSKDYTVE